MKRNESNWMTTEEAADLLRTSQQRVRKMVYSRQIPGYKFHGRWLFRRDELQQLIEGTRKGVFFNANQRSF